MAKKNLSELDALEQQAAATETNVQQPIVETENKEVQPNLLDGYHKINNYDLPHEGILYPESWSFAYRCPTAKEVANFSTVNETDQPAIMAVIEDLIRKCVIIYDSASKTKISTGEICDAHKTYFLLLLRALYLPGSPVTFKTVCQTCHETYDVSLEAQLLDYKQPNNKLISSYNGRSFSLNMGNGNQIDFRIPTIDTTGKLFKYIVKAYRATSNNNEKKEDNVVFDKHFLLLAPYLFESGKERIQDIIYKYKQIMKNDSLFKDYMTIINKINLDNSETFENVCVRCGSEEEAEVKFPGGFRKLFVSTQDATGYFD